MPLSEKVRVEVYLPDLLTPAYRNLLDALEQEFTYTFGGCTTLRGLAGNYLSYLGLIIPDRVNLVYTDLPLVFGQDLPTLSEYTDHLRTAAFQALDEETILIALYTVHHSASD